MLKTSVVIICGSAIGIALLATYVVLKINHIDTSDLLPLVIGVLAAVPGTAAWHNSQEIKKQTNGPLHQTHEIVNNVETRLAAVEESLNNVLSRLE